jgi:sulfate adenylyltransferase subunit 1
MNNAIAQQIETLGIEDYLHQQQHKSLLRFLTCGSVDDGKSTLIGRLLHDTHQIYEDQLASLEKDSQRVGTTGNKMDLALLVDGLQSEREQGITIDVAYRYFSTVKRKFIIADTPGHEQYTRNMATGASTCDLAIILIDARYGVQDQTRRHSYIASLLGIKQFIVAVNKMDLVDFNEQTFAAIKQDYLAFADGLGDIDIQVVPLSALDGDNVVVRSLHTPWYHGEPLLSLLESASIETDDSAKPLRFPVQYVNRPNLDFRGFSGTIAAGEVRVGDTVVSLPSGQRSRVSRIVTFDGDLESARQGDAITLTLTDEIDISRGDILVPADSVPSLSAHLSAHVVWMDEAPLTSGKQYDIKLGSKKTSGFVHRFVHRIDVNSLEHQPTTQLALNEIALTELELLEPVSWDRYQSVRDTGGFIIIDRLTNRTVGAGMINGQWQSDGAKVNGVCFESELTDLIKRYFPVLGASAIALAAQGLIETLTHDKN